MKKSSVTNHLFVSFFEVKNQNEPIAIKIYAHMIFTNAANSLISDKVQEKWNGKVT